MLPGKRTSVRYPSNRQQAKRGKPADAREITLEQLVAIKVRALSHRRRFGLDSRYPNKAFVVRVPKISLSAREYVEGRTDLLPSRPKLGKGRAISAQELRVCQPGEHRHLPRYAVRDRHFTSMPPKQRTPGLGIPLFISFISFISAAVPR
jgi:hypothetical protein